MLKLNEVKFSGHLGDDLNTRTLENGNKVATVNLAIDDSYKDKNGEWQKRTQWARLVLWNKTVDYAESRFSKGDHVFVEAKYTSRQYEDKDGVKKTTVEFVVNAIQATQKRDSTSSNNFPSETDEPAQSGDDDLAF